MSISTKIGEIGAKVNSRRGEKIAGVVCTLLGLALLAGPFTVFSGMQSGMVLGMLLGGGFLLVLGALLASERTPTGDAVRYQA